MVSNQQNYNRTKSVIRRTKTTKLNLVRTSKTEDSSYAGQALVTKPADPNSIPGTHTEGEKLSSDLHNVPGHPHAHMHKFKKIKVI